MERLIQWLTDVWESSFAGTDRKNKPRLVDGPSCSCLTKVSNSMAEIVGSKPLMRIVLELVVGDIAKQMTITIGRN